MGVTKGANQHSLPLKALEVAGLSEADVEVVYYSAASDGLSAFQQGSFDVLGTWDPYLAIIEAQIETTTIVTGKALTDNRTFYFASEERLSEDSDVMKIILQELEESDKWANEDIDKVASILSGELALDKEPLLTAKQRRTFGVLPIDAQAVTAQQELADAFYRVGLFENPLVISDFVTENPDWLPDDVN